MFYLEGVTTGVLQGLSLYLSCLTFLSVTQRRGLRTPSLQMTAKGTKWLLCLSGGAGQGTGTGWEWFHEIQQGQGWALPGDAGWGWWGCGAALWGISSPGPCGQQFEQGLGVLLRSPPAWITIRIYEHTLWFDPAWLFVSSLPLSVFISHFI